MRGRVKEKERGEKERREKEKEREREIGLEIWLISPVVLIQPIQLWFPVCENVKVFMHQLWFFVNHIQSMTSLL